MFDPITLNQIKKALVKDKATVTHVEASIAVNNSSTWFTLKSVTGGKGYIVAISVHQATAGDRMIDQIRITVDGTAVTSTGLGGGGFAPFPYVGSTASYPIILPLNARFKSSFTVEVKGHAGYTGTCYASCIWTQEI